jgi:predicted RNA polymerase sigma factor
MCCHPALTSSSAISLTLRAVGGLTTAEIAIAFLVPEATMAQRISRAKQSIKSSNLPFSMPTDEERGARMVAVLHMLYLVFSEVRSWGLELVKSLDTMLAGHYRLDAVRGHLYERAGDRERAIAHYRAAAQRTASAPERDYLDTKAARVVVEERGRGGLGTPDGWTETVNLRQQLTFTVNMR